MKRPPLALLSIVPPPPVLCVVPLEVLVDFRLELLIERWAVCLILVHPCHYVEHSVEIMCVIHELLVKECIDYQVPHLLVVPSYIIQFFCQIIERSLVEDDLSGPFGNDDLLIVRVQLLKKVAPVELAVLSEGFQQPADLLDVHHLDVVFE